MSRSDVDSRILAICDKVKAKRPKTVIEHIINHGSINTEELQSIYNYDHPPRAIRDVRESGIPIKTSRVASKKTGRKIAEYRFDSPDNIIQGRIGGRTAFSKKFKKKLIDIYGARDAITSERSESRYLQIDRRIPYEVIGDAAHDESSPEKYMLLDASSQRAKSWSCEQCENWLNDRDEAVCKSCFWACPEYYTHIAGENIRRVDLEWRGSEVKVFEQIRKKAEKEDIAIATFIKRLLEKKIAAG